MNKGLKRLIRTIIIIAAAALLLLSPFMRLFESMAVMGIYSAVNADESLLKDEGVEISIPGGLKTAERDWYPFVMTFNADSGFSRFISRPGTRLTIMYNFPQFSLLRGCSGLYDEASPLYSSFYGAYAVKTQGGQPFGFALEEGEYVLDEESTALVPQYDYHYLVLRDFGLEADDAAFDWSITHSEKCDYLGSGGWTRIDADLTVNGCAHEYEDFTQSYFQYGTPAYPAQRPLAAVDMKGRVYAKYFPEKDVSIFMYVLTADEAELERTDSELLSKSKIVFSER